MNANVQPYVIVVGVDYSETSALALEKAFELAAEKGLAEVHAVNIVRNYGEFVELEGATPTPYRLSMADAQKRLHEHVTDRVDDFGERTGKKFSRCVSHIRLEFAAEEIAQLAADVHADIVVVGTHGRRGLRRLFLGSVAEGVVRLAQCPVLVVRPKGESGTVPQIEPPCPRCVETRAATNGEVMWCEQHRERHGQRHTYHYESRVAKGTNFPL
ncbi:MAG TPA: universal stress protein, partial [Polyangiaceae bacterium]|nr:universal stress protein [Polyangiaceae bacterium]